MRSAWTDVFDAKSEMKRILNNATNEQWQSDGSSLQSRGCSTHLGARDCIATAVSRQCKLLVRGAVSPTVLARDWFSAATDEPRMNAGCCNFREAALGRARLDNAPAEPLPQQASHSTDLTAVGRPLMQTERFTQNFILTAQVASTRSIQEHEQFCPNFYAFELI
jgi:hypothetical protein